jgi:hypothetical protein
MIFALLPGQRLRPAEPATLFAAGWLSAFIFAARLPPRFRRFHEAFAPPLMLAAIRRAPDSAAAMPACADTPRIALAFRCEAARRYQANIFAADRFELIAELPPMPDF